ncbi:MAG: sigma-E factor negative regulatory protein [Pseudomonadota bacterium]
MAEEKREWISALADGELSGTRLGETLKQLSTERSLQQSWSRYHLIRDTLHSNLEAELDTRLSERISAALEREPVLLAPQRQRRSWLRHAAGIAVAASVTGVAVLGVQQLNREQGAAPPQMAEVMQPNNVVRLDSAEGAATEPNKQDRRNLAPYLVNHSEYALSSGMHGMLPYARVVGHGGGK